jgi:hypothetical protein
MRCGNDRTGAVGAERSDCDRSTLNSGPHRQTRPTHQRTAGNVALWDVASIQQLDAMPVAMGPVSAILQCLALLRLAQQVRVKVYCAEEGSLC